MKVQHAFDHLIFLKFPKLALTLTANPSLTLDLKSAI